MAQLGERRGIKAQNEKSRGAGVAGVCWGTINPAKGGEHDGSETPERVHVTADDIEAANDLIDFIEACPQHVPYGGDHYGRARRGGLTYLPENAAWDIEPGGRYYTQRNTSSVVAFKGGRGLAATWGEDGVAGDYYFSTDGVAQRFADV